MTGWKRWSRLALGIVLVVGLYFAVPVSVTRDESGVVRLLLSAGALGLLTALQVWQVRLQLERPEHRIDGLVLALVVGVLAFALSFYVMELREPGEIEGLHTRLDALYFTMSTLLTIGYGDVHAVGQAARTVVLVQMVFNVAVVATAATTLSQRVRQSAAARAETRRIARAEDASTDR